MQCLLKVLTKFTLVDGFWHHKRIDEELQNASIQQANASEKGRKAAAARWGRPKIRPIDLMQRALLKHCPCNAHYLHLHI